MRIIHRLSLMVILALTFLLMDPIIIAGQGGCDCGNDCVYYNPAQSSSEQSLWVMNTYYFLDDCDPLYGSAYNQSQQSANSYNATAIIPYPAYNSMPIYASINNVPSYNTSTNN